MSHEKHYECLERVLGKCGIDPACKNDLKNARCDRFYPCHRVSLGSEVITYIPSQAREIQSEMLKKLEDMERPHQPALVEPTDE